MLADSSPFVLSSGALSDDVQLPASFMASLLDFIGDELPKWRDRPDRPRESSETTLTSQLCSHLNSASRLSAGWDILQFRIEEPDEQQKGRKIDLVPAPCGVRVWINGRSYSDFEALFPIECKRLPTPPGDKRDEREYVVSRYGTTGGVQRFKSVLHGGSHNLAAMIGYVQEDTLNAWYERVSSWISDLAAAGQDGWSDSDSLQILRTDEVVKLCLLRSLHNRPLDATPIDLRHFWLEMN